MVWIKCIQSCTPSNAKLHTGLIIRGSVLYEIYCCVCVCVCVWGCVCKHLQPTTVPCLHINQLNSFRKLTTQITVVSCNSFGIAIFCLIIPQKIKITLGVFWRYTHVFSHSNSMVIFIRYTLCHVDRICACAIDVKMASMKWCR